MISFSYADFINQADQTVILLSLFLSNFQILVFI